MKIGRLLIKLRQLSSSWLEKSEHYTSMEFQHGVNGGLRRAHLDLEQLIGATRPNAGDCYIVSLKYSKEFIVFWRPSDNGYTLFLELAGRYSAERVKEKQSYYNNGESTLAVPCSVVERVARVAVYSDDWSTLRAGRVPTDQVTQ